MSRSTIPTKRTAEAQEAAWIADEDKFVLRQAKKKAVMRVKGGRAQPVDWLAVTLAIIDPEKNPLDDEVEIDDVDVVDPAGIFEGLKEDELLDLEKGIETYLTLESSKSNREYWTMMKTISQSHRQQSQTTKSTVRGVISVATDLDKLLGPKNLAELEKLEKQIKAKLSSNEPIDTDYWEHLLSSLLTYKAKAKLRKVTQSMIDARMGGLRRQQAADAASLKDRLVLQAINETAGSEVRNQPQGDVEGGDRHALDPEPLLRLRTEDKALQSTTHDEFNRDITDSRRRVLRRGYIGKRVRDDTEFGPPAKRIRADGADASGHNTVSQYDREVARGLSENEEIFTAEEPVTTKNLASWSQTYRPRKPRYFNRMLKGYEWNKYNQTHYDHDNPPPRVVQGYKFNIFYPDLVDKTKAPTYRIEREDGRRRGQTSAPAGEDDTCLIRFTAGPPYEDIAFRIVDREWDYSAKRERGFRSSFDKGILQLNFQFKKIYYRK